MSDKIIQEFIKATKGKIGAHWNEETEIGQKINEAELREIIGKVPVEVIDMGDDCFVLAVASDPTRFGEMLAFSWEEDLTGGCVR